MVKPNSKITMKTSKLYIGLVCGLVFIAGACKTDNLEYTDVKVSPVKALYEPTDERSVKLLNSASASLYFEWEAVKVEDGGAAIYEVLFDKADGDFSDPVYRVVSDNNGYMSGASVTHRVLNRVGTMAGIEPGQTGSLRWTVVASRGINEVRSEASRVLNITLLQGFVDVPDEVFIVGEGSEAGANLADALPFKRTAAGEYEIFTALEQGKTYRFVDRRSGTPRVFVTTNGSSLSESTEEGSITVDKTGVFRINLDFNMATLSYAEITKMGVFFSPNNAVILDMPYAGKGTWSGTGVIDFKQEGWGKDERYKFQMETINNGQPETLQLGTVNGTDSRPNSNSPASYYFVRILPNLSQWDDKWKFADAVDGKSNTVTMVLQGDKDYTHIVQVN